MRSIVAEPATGNQVLFRLLGGPAPQRGDFRGRRDLPSNRPVSPDTPWLLLAGVSMFDSPAGARSVSQRTPTYVARLTLKQGRGVHLAATGARGHWTVWGAPTVLEECIDQVNRT